MQREIGEKWTALPTGAVDQPQVRQAARDNTPHRWFVQRQARHFNPVRLDQHQLFCIDGGKILHTIELLTMLTDRTNHRVETLPKQSISLMQSLSIQLAQPGMRLVSDIKDGNGRILLPTASILDERKLKALRTWGITEVAVAVEEAPRPTRVELSPEQSAQIEAMVSDCFRHNDASHPAVEELQRLIFNRAAVQLGYCNDTADA